MSLGKGGTVSDLDSAIPKYGFTCNGNNRHGIKVVTEVLLNLSLHGISTPDALAFFAGQVEAMIAVEPNYGPHRNNRRITYDTNHWIMRGFFPDTPVFFKIVVTKCHEDHITKYHANVTAPPITGSYKFGRRGSKQHRQAPCFTFYGMEHYLSEFAESEMLDTKRPDTEPIQVQMKMPRCMSPKGVPVHRFKGRLPS